MPRLIDPNTEFEAFKRQTASNNGSGLGNGNFCYFTSSPGSGAMRSHPDGQPTRSEPLGPSPSPKSMPKSRNDSLETVELAGGRDSAYASSSELRQASDSPSDAPAFSDGSPASIQSPLQKPFISPANDRHRPGSISPDKREMATLMMRRHHHRESQMANREDKPAMVAPAQLKEMIEQLPCSEFILLDLRVFPQFSESRIKGALNLCIPTTLLKRPSFNVQKLQDTFANDNEKARFSQWVSARYIIVYDTCSSESKDAMSAMNTLKKFSNEGWKGTGYILKGGYVAFSKTYPDLVDNRSSREMQSSKINLTLGTAMHKGAPVAGGCLMPLTENAANPFFGNIRQNQDLRDGVGLVDIKLPEELKNDTINILPKWLHNIVRKEDEGKKAAQTFTRIEEEERERMKKALSVSTCYDARSAERDDFQVAGLEKGSKNRYNNIWPFEQTRVRLQGRPEGACDYVNASHIKATRSNKRYIASQGPLPDTFEDFWSVIWEQDVRVIVMLTAEEEGGQLKCHSYWTSRAYGPLKVKILSEKKVSLIPGKLRIQAERRELGRRRATTSAENTPVTPVTDQHVAILRTFAVSHASYPFTPIREITQIQYTDWPDFGAPASPTQILSLIDLSNQTTRAASGLTGPPHPMTPEEDKNVRPILVHCSAGCGRTGTFCTVDSVIDMMKRQHKERRSGVVPMDTSTSGKDDLEGPWLFEEGFDLIEATVEDFRRQRLSMVQSLKQYALCYETVTEWVAQVYLSARTTSSRARSGSDVGFTHGNA